MTEFDDVTSHRTRCPLHAIVPRFDELAGLTWIRLSLINLSLLTSSPPPSLSPSTSPHTAIDTMAPPPAISRVTGNVVPDHYIHSDSAYFRDVHGRALLLRGVNFSGSAKAPVGQPSQKLEGFWEAGESGDMTFIGRPLDLDDGSADVGGSHCSL